MTTFLTYTVLQTLLMIILAPLPTGVIKKVKARFQKRRGASIFQPYYDIIKLLKKPRTHPTFTGKKNV